MYILLNVSPRAKYIFAVDKCGMLVILSMAMCEHPDIRYCRVPDCAKHPAEQTGPETWAQWYCHTCGESVSEALAIERGACAT